MALPTGMQTFTLTFGAAGVLGLSEDLSMRVTFTAATNAIWAATGQPYLLKPQTATAAIGGTGTATLISPDQDGFINGNGQTVRNWTYAVHIDYVDNAGATVASADKNLAYITSMGPTIDLDLTVPVTTSAGVVVSVPGSDAAARAILNGVTQIDIGHSYLGGSEGWLYNKMLSTVDLATSRINLAQSGDRPLDTIRRIAGTGTIYPVNTIGIVVMQDLLNHVRRYGATGLNARLEVQNIYGAILSLIGARGKIENASGTFTGTWSQNAETGASGGTVAYTATPGSYVDYSFFGPSVDILGMQPYNTVSTFSVSVDGGTAVNTTVDNIGATPGANIHHVMARLRGLSNGNHTVRVTFVSGSQLKVDVVLEQMPVPPKVFLVKDPKIAGWALDSANNNSNGSDAAMDAYWAIIDQLATVYTNVVPVAVPTWNSATMMSTDQIHPNAYGHKVIRDTVKTAILATVPTYSAGVHFGGSF